MPNGRQYRGAPQTRLGQHAGGGGSRREGPSPIDTSDIQLRQPKPDLFDGVAHRAAKTIALDQRNGREREKRTNKPSQIRKFFDELVMWEAKINAGKEDEALRKARFDDALPFIRMLNAKAAYAKGRQLIDESFQDLLGHCLKQVEDPTTLRNCRLFFEALLGFYKAYRHSDQ